MAGVRPGRRPLSLRKRDIKKILAAIPGLPKKCKKDLLEIVGITIAVYQVRSSFSRPGASKLRDHFDRVAKAARRLEEVIREPANDKTFRRVLGPFQSPLVWAIADNEASRKLAAMKELKQAARGIQTIRRAAERARDNADLKAPKGKGGAHRQPDVALRSLFSRFFGLYVALHETYPNVIDKPAPYLREGSLASSQFVNFIKASLNAAGAHHVTDSAIRGRWQRWKTERWS